MYFDTKPTMKTLDTTKAMELGYLDSLAGLFRGERCEIIREADANCVWVKLLDSLDPDKEILVSRDCILL